MEQPVGGTSAGVPNSDSQKKKQKRKIPSPRELVSHYESQGMDTQAASFKVIEDLQNAVFRMMLSGKNKSAPAGQASDTSRKLDVINARLLQLEMKVDSKPGFPQMIAVGVGSGAIVSACASAASQIWTAVRRATNTTSD